MSSACMPGSGLPWSVGNHDKVVAYCISDWPIPITEADQAGDPQRVESGEQAAASAGTMNSASVLELAWASGAATMPIAPASADASTVFAIESWFGDSPASMPNTSFSEAARVARPNRVQRNSAPSAIAIRRTTPAIQNRLTGNDVPNTFTKSFGKMLGIGLAASRTTAASSPGGSAGSRVKRRAWRAVTTCGAGGTRAAR